MIAQTIQLALAPVFVLVAIGHFLNTLSARLSRVADRARDLEHRYAATTGRASTRWWSTSSARPTGASC